MAVDQTHIDDIILAATSDDPAVKLQNLEREVDLLKITIKRLLMDIRERMNELENPFTLVSSGNSGAKQPAVDPEYAEKTSALEAREAALDARESCLEIESASLEKDLREEPPVVVLPASTVPALQYPLPVNTLSELPERGIPPASPPQETLPLQKTYHLYCWTDGGVKKFGHSQLEALVESYHVLGYISKKNAGAIKQISSLMPVAPDEFREIGPYQFIEEMYTLNRILSPGDTSLDRDMIEVMMEQRRQESRLPIESGSPVRYTEPTPEKRKARSSEFGEKDLGWMNLQA
nr:hypothetical protein [uncultured Methanoregula sp.]